MIKPIVMVSSTFYDLKQIRNEMQIFIQSFGYESFLSESHSFPINTQLGTIDNCKQKVEIYADILILIIGGRYGSIDDRTGKSVTNLEYIEARKKGIPVYVFIEDQILSYLDIWKKNKTADFSGAVDTTEVFEFVERIRNVDSVWTFSFNVANDIKETLRNQFAYLFKSALLDKIKLHSQKTDRIYDSLSSSALRLIYDKPDGWEYLLFFKVWIDEITKIEDKIYEFEHHITFLESESILPENTIEWILLRSHEIRGYVESANLLINTRAPEAFGPPGIEAKEREIILIAKSLVKILSAIIDWSIKIRIVKSDEPFTRVLNELSKFPKSIVSNMIDFPKRAFADCEKALLKTNPNETKQLNLTIVFELSNFDEFNLAFEAMKSQL